MKSLMIFVLLATWSGRALAEDKPLYVPLRDVNVTYRLIGGQPASPAKEAHLYYSAALNKLRLDEPSQKGYAVIDRGAQQMFVVMAQEHSFVQMPFDPAMARGFILNDDMSFSHAGSDTVAGLPCTKWNVVSTRASGTVCVTADGVMLSGQGKAHDGAISGIEATAVSYAAQPASLFAPPPDFKQIKVPALRVPQ
jgi:hypothetical protein